MEQSQPEESRRICHNLMRQLLPFYEQQAKLDLPLPYQNISTICFGSSPQKMEATFFQFKPINLALNLLRYQICFFVTHSLLWRCFAQGFTTKRLSFQVTQVQ